MSETPPYSKFQLSNAVHPLITEMHDKELLSVIQGLEETCPRMNQAYDRGPEWPQEIHVLLNILELKLSTGTLDPLPLLLWLHPGLGTRVTLHQLDTLSHWVNHQIKEEDNQNQMMLLDEWFHPTSEPNKFIAVNRDSPSHFTIKGEGSSFLEQVHNCTNQEDSKTLKELVTRQGLCGEEWQEKDRLALYWGRVYVPQWHIDTWFMLKIFPVPLIAAELYYLRVFLALP